MRTEYALQGVEGFAHWSDAWPTLALARKAAKELVKGSKNKVQILKRQPLPTGHQIGARWAVVCAVTA